MKSTGSHEIVDSANLDQLETTAAIWLIISEHLLDSAHFFNSEMLSKHSNQPKLGCLAESLTNILLIRARGVLCILAWWVIAGSHRRLECRQHAVRDVVDLGVLGVLVWKHGGFIFCVPGCHCQSVALPAIVVGVLAAASTVSVSCVSTTWLDECMHFQRGRAFCCL